MKLSLIALLTIIGFGLAQDVLRPKIDQDAEDAAHFNDRGTDRVVENRQLAIPPTLCLRVKAIYNTDFKDQVKRTYGNSKTPGQVIREGMQIADDLFHRPGLGTKITIHLVGEPVYTSDPSAQWSSLKFGNAPLWHPSVTTWTDSDTTVDHFMFFGQPFFALRDKDTQGYANKGTVCYKAQDSKYHKTTPNNISITKYAQYFRRKAQDLDGVLCQKHESVGPYHGT